MIMQPTETTHPVQKKIDRRTKVALWIMIGPTALIIVTLVAYAVVNIVTGAVPPDQDAALNPNPDSIQAALAISIINIVLFAIGSLSFLAWLPGLITGIVLLATRKPTHAKN